MPDATVELVGNKEALEEFRRDLQADAAFAGVVIDPPLRSKQFDSMGEVLLTLMLHIPPGIAAHALYEWIKNWRTTKGKDVQPKDAPKS